MSDHSSREGQIEDGASLLILGLGNLICSDDGVGVAAVDQLCRRYEMPAGVRALDGGTHGMTLLCEFEGVDDVILVDAVGIDQPPGTPVRFEGEEVMAAVRDRLSAHQVGVADLLDALRWTDSLPRRIVLLGLVPGTTELGLGLTPEVEAGLAGLTLEVAEEAVRMGYALRRRGDDEAFPEDSGDPAIRALRP